MTTTEKMLINATVTIATSNVTGHMTTTQMTSHAEIGTMPTIVFVAILSVIGFIGNIHVLVVFIFKVKHKSTYTVYVTSLAIIDLLVCTIHMPGEILDLYIPYDFWSSVTCRLFRFNNFALSVASVFVLLAVAIDRYKRVCRTLGKQWSVSFSKKLVIGSATMGVFFASPALVLFGIRTIDLSPNKTVETCFFSNEYKDSMAIVIWIGFVYMAFIVGCIIMVFSYGSIGYHIRKQAKERAFLTKSINSDRKIDTEIYNGAAISSKNKFKPRRSKSDIFNNISHISESKLELALHQLDSDKLNTFPRNQSSKSPYKAKIFKASSLSSLTKDKVTRSGNATRASSMNSIASGLDTPRSKEKSMSKEANKTTKTVSLITVIFIICYIPYLTFGIVFGLNPEFKSYLNEEELIVYRLAMRLSLVNNVCNPFIYGIFDKRFMQLCKDMYRQCFRCQCQQTYEESKTNSVQSYI